LSFYESLKVCPGKFGIFLSVTVCEPCCN